MRTYLYIYYVYLVEEVRAEAGVAAEPLVGTVLAAFDDVSGDHAASIPQRSLPGELHRALVLVLPGQVHRGTGTLCMGWTQKTQILLSNCFMSACVVGFYVFYYVLCNSCLSLCMFYLTARQSH